MPQGIVEIDGKQYYQSGEFKVEAYPELTRQDEAIKLLVNAHDTFFGLAQNSIGISPYIFNKDKTGYLHDRKEVVATVLKGRRKLYEDSKQAQPPEEQRVAAAKYVGALVEMLGVLGEEMVVLAYEGGREKELQEMRKEMEPMLTEAYALLHNVHLKGHVVDMDGVLRAQLGETVKAAITPTHLDFVHKGDYGKIIGAMQDVSAISKWMDEQIPRQDEYVEIRKALDEYNGKVLTRLGIRREDQFPDETNGNVPRRDKMEMEIEGLKDRLISILDTAQGKRTRLSGHIRRGTELMYEMIKQGEKPVSTHFLFAVRHAEAVCDTMKELVMKHPALKSLKEPIENLSYAASTHLKKTLYDGTYREDRHADFKKAEEVLEQAIEGITFPKSLPKKDAQAMIAVLYLLEKGARFIGQLAPNLDQQSRTADCVRSGEMGYIRKLRRDAADFAGQWQQEAAALSSGHEIV